MGQGVGGCLGCCGRDIGDGSEGWPWSWSCHSRGFLTRFFCLLHGCVLMINIELIMRMFLMLRQYVWVGWCRKLEPLSNLSVRRIETRLWHSSRQLDFISNFQLSRQAEWETTFVTITFHDEFVEKCSIICLCQLWRTSQGSRWSLQTLNSQNTFKMQQWTFQMLTRLSLVTFSLFLRQ